jgi:hypothetical protein
LPSAIPEACGVAFIRVDDNTDLQGADIVDGGFNDIITPKACCQKCAETQGCKYWTFGSDVSKCWVKSSVKGQEFQSHRQSGTLAMVSAAPTQPIGTVAPTQVPTESSSTSASSSVISVTAAPVVVTATPTETTSGGGHTEAPKESDESATDQAIEDFKKWYALQHRLKTVPPGTPTLDPATHPSVHDAILNSGKVKSPSLQPMRPFTPAATAPKRSPIAIINKLLHHPPAHKGNCNPYDTWTEKNGLRWC